jgi:hypothetical protein
MFHTVLCLIIYIVHTSFGGESYRVVFSGFPLPDYLHRPYIFRRGQLTRFFVLASLEGFSRGTLPDYLHRPYIFRRGELSRFFLLGSLCLIIYIVRTSFGGDSYRVFFVWIPWRVFHAVLCLIIYIVRTSFGGESYRVFLSGFPGGFFTRYSAWLFASSVHLSKGRAIAFFFWVPWEVFHTVLCLIMYIVGTSFEGESYRLFFLGSLGSLNDSRPAGDKTSPPGFEPATVGIWRPCA